MRQVAQSLERAALAEPRFGTPGDAGAGKRIYPPLATARSSAPGIGFPHSESGGFFPPLVCSRSPGWYTWQTRGAPDWCDCGCVLGAGLARSPYPFDSHGHPTTGRMSMADGSVMARILFALLVISAAFAQVTILPATAPLRVLPSLVLVLLLLWAALRGVVEGMAWVFAIGLLLDMLAMDAIGTNGLALLPVALMAGPARRRFFQSGMVLPLALVVVATLTHALLLGILRAIGHDEIALQPGAILRIGFLQALLNALLVPPLYVVASWMNRWVLERA